MTFDEQIAKFAAQVKVISKTDGGQVAVCGAWVLIRKDPDGKCKYISVDAPAPMMIAAEQALGIERN